MLTPYLPYPLVSGGQIRTYNLLKNLSLKHDITLAAFIRHESEKKYLENLKAYCKKVIFFKRRKAWSPVNITLSAVSPYPFLVSIYFDPKIKRAINEELKKQNYDLIHAETFYVMPNIPRTNVPILLVEQVIEYLVYQRFVESLPAWMIFLKPFLFFDVAKIKFWEKHYWKKAKRLAAMSQEDKDFIQSLDSSLKVDVVANGVDIEFFDRVKKRKPKIPTILFVGNFKWLPNRDAAQFLVKEIWPKIKTKIKGAKLWIVGRNPPPDILSYSSNDIKVEGDIEDIRKAYALSSVLLAPIRNGRGTKYKILEAMATKTPIVGTKLATEGIKIKNGQEAFVENTAQGLAKKTIHVLKDKDIGEKLAESAYTLVSTKYNWETISAKLDQVYKKVGAI